MTTLISTPNEMATDFIIILCNLLPLYILLVLFCDLMMKSTSAPPTRLFNNALQ